MATKLKLVTIAGTRPEIIKLSKTINACDEYFDHSLIHTGQNWDYTLNEVFFKEFGLREPDYFLNCASKDLGTTIGNIISKSYQILSKEKPDALLILGDTNSALSAISAKRLKIPIFHMEAGNRCFDENLPEEINRKIIDHISDINLAYTEHARRNLLAEGISGEYIFVTGSPMAEILDESAGKIADSVILKKLKLEKDKYILVSAHREENIDNEGSFTLLMNAINDIARTYQMPVIFSTHPRTMGRLIKKKFKMDKLVQNLKPFGFFDFNRLQLDSFCVLSDSGTLAEESSILGFNAVSLRTSTERPEVLDKGSFIIGGIKTAGILQAIEMARLMKKNSAEALPLPPDYQDKNVSAKVVKIIQSYTEIARSKYLS